MTITIRGEMKPRFDTILTDDALEFLVALHREFCSERHDRLEERMVARNRVEAGRDLHFLPETAATREDDSWRVAGAGPGLVDRRIEITGPTDAKMTINAMNSGANAWLADHEDATSPTWENVIGGQINLFDAIRGQLEYTSPEGKEYRVTAENTPTIVMRPRGWHLVEKNLRITSETGQVMPMSASLVDFGLYFFHNAHELVARGAGPYFYLPKLENHLEARLWDDIFTFSEKYIGMPHGTIRATVLIETLSAAFEMDEILFELKDHCAGLNAGRWDYMFSIIKTYRSRGKRHVLPDRDQLAMTLPFMRAYTNLLVKTCHRRGAHAIGGMSAFIPNRQMPDVTEAALEKVALDKRREANDGFDGSWVAHPGLIDIARGEFDAVLKGQPNQLDRQRTDVDVSAADLLDFSSAGSQVTEAGVRGNISVTIRYVEAWLRGYGAVALDNLMEDAATAEISRSLIWQWVNQRVVTVENTEVTRALVRHFMQDIVEQLPRPEGNRIDDAVSIFETVALSDDYPTFLTIPAYAQYLVASQREPELVGA